MIKFSAFSKGWIGRTLPELMPKGSLQRCDDLNFTIEGGLRCGREILQKPSLPSGVSKSNEIKDYFSVTLRPPSGTSTLEYFINQGQLSRVVDSGTSRKLLGMSGESWVTYAVMTPQPSTRPYVYMGTPAGLVRDVGDTHLFTSGSTWVMCGVSAPTVGPKLEATGTSGLDQYTKLCLHCDGSQGSTTFTDAMGNHTPITKGEAEIYTTHKKFGTGSGHFSRATGDSVRITDSADWFMDDAAFTIDFWLNSQRSVAGAEGLFQQYESGTTFTRCYITLAGGSPREFHFSSKTSAGTGMSLDTGSLTLPHNVWRHIAVIRGWASDTTKLALCIDGDSWGTQDSCTASWADMSGVSFDIGYSLSPSGISSFHGYIDEFRVSKGVARWTSIFTPPASQYRDGLASGSSYTYSYTYYDSRTGAESKPSPTASIQPSAEAVKITGVSAWGGSAGLAGSYADKIKFYRSINMGSSQYLLTTGDKDAGNIYYDGTEDIDLGLLISDVGRPEQSGTLVQSFKERLWYSGFSTLDGAEFSGEDVRDRAYFSRRGYPETVPPDYYISIGDMEAVPKAWAVMSDSLYLLTENKIYEIIGNSADSFKFEDTLSHVGTTSTKSVALGPDGIYFINYTGVYCYKVKAEKISEQIDWLFTKSHDTWHSTLPTRAEIRDARGAYWQGAYYLTIGSNTYVYESEFKRWRKRTTELTCPWTDTVNDYLYSGVTHPSLSYHTLGRVITGDSSGTYTGLATPDFITKAEYINQDEETGMVKVGYIERFRVDALGYWTFYFYVDGVLAATQTGTTYTAASRSITYPLPQSIKGTTCYVRGLSGASRTPYSTRFYSMIVEP